MMPLSLFRDTAFAATNAVTLLLYAALGSLLFLLMLELQIGLQLPPVNAGLTLLPATVLMLGLSPLTGRWGQAHGARWPMTLGSLLAALAFLAFLLLHPAAMDRGLARAVLRPRAGPGGAPLTVAVLDAGSGAAGSPGTPRSAGGARRGGGGPLAAGCRHPATSLTPLPDRRLYRAVVIWVPSRARSEAPA
jgi:hypothetical protein